MIELDRCRRWMGFRCPYWIAFRLRPWFLVASCRGDCLPFRWIGRFLFGELGLRLRLFWWCRSRRICWRMRCLWLLRSSWLRFLGRRRGSRVRICIFGVLIYLLFICIFYGKDSLEYALVIDSRENSVISSGTVHWWGYLGFYGRLEGIAMRWNADISGLKVYYSTI